MGEVKNKTTGKRTFLRVVALLFLLAIAVCFLVFGMSSQDTGKRDFVEYWAAGKLLVTGQDPYDPASILKLERLAGSTRAEAQVSFSPPVALLFALPLGYLNARWAAVIWMLAIVLALVGSIRILRSIYSSRDDQIHQLGYLFAPVFACLMVGQLDIFFLLVLSLFLKLHAERPFLAGLVLFPLATKPHLFLPFTLVLLAWSIYRREFRVVLGGLCGLAASMLVILSIDPHAWSQYFRMVQTVQPMHLFIPTWSVQLRSFVNPQAVWVQFVPEAACCIWALWYFWTRRSHWSWTEQGAAVLLVSVLCAAYAWFYDEVIVLPAIFATLKRKEETGGSLLPFGIIALPALLEIMWRIDLANVYYLWTTPAWLAWYVYAMYGSAPSSAEQPAAEAQL
ncbi:MAG TPA: glycosyltransferase family 87 protein [Terracidiphilus sp.]|jgi:hypothetical protein